jgi:hypothetical protein
MQLKTCDLFSPNEAEQTTNTASTRTFDTQPFDLVPLLDKPCGSRAQARHGCRIICHPQIDHREREKKSNALPSDSKTKLSAVGNCQRDANFHGKSIAIAPD